MHTHVGISVMERRGSWPDDYGFLGNWHPPAPLSHAQVTFRLWLIVHLIFLTLQPLTACRLRSEASTVPGRGPTLAPDSGSKKETDIHSKSRGSHLSPHITPSSWLLAPPSGGKEGTPSTQQLVVRGAGGGRGLRQP